MTFYRRFSIQSVAARNKSTSYTPHRLDRQFTEEATPLEVATTKS
jgi:hypothetical protein